MTATVVELHDAHVLAWHKHTPAITTRDFLAALFPAHTGHIWVTSIKGDPEDETARGRYKGRRYDPDEPLDESKNLYYSISTLKEGATSRSKTKFEAMYLLPLDDIGTNKESSKVAAEKILLSPTYRIETAPNNFQWGFALKVPITNASKASRLLELASRHGATDRGGMNIVRYVRLPGGINGKPKHQRGGEPWQVRLREWAPDRRYTPEEIAQAFGFDLEGQRGRPKNQLPVLAPTDDPILALLNALGWVMEPKPNEKGWIAIICPWLGEHSDPNAGTAYYKVGGAFKCHHHHCVNRRLSDVFARIRTMGEKEAVALDDAIAKWDTPHGGLLRLMQEYIFVFAIDRFVHLEQGSVHPVEAVDHMIAHEMPGFKPSKFLLESDNMRKVHSYMYLPGKGEMLQLNCAGRPMLVANKWRSGPVAVAKTCDLDAVQPWLDQLAWLFPDQQERAIVLDYLTHLVKHRGEKINYALTMVSQWQGAGRDSLVKPIRAILGIGNVRTITTRDLFEAFNTYEQAELVYLSEMKAPEHSKWQIYDKLKDKIVMPPDTVQINEKFVPQVEQPKVANWVILTNDLAAIALDVDDRRFVVAETQRSQKEIADRAESGTYEALHARYDDPAWMANFHRYLVDNPISRNFEPKGRPPRTDAKVRMLRESRSGIESYVEEKIEAAEGNFKPDLVKLRDLMFGVKLEFANATDHALAAALRRAGAELLPEFKDGQINVRGVWALRKVARYLGMSKPALREAWVRVPRKLKAEF